ncbi:MAG: threonine aldolase [Saprospiraceae bacterium]|nr:threonine aldolase [Candidatus Opimibacter iunctus]
MHSQLINLTSDTLTKPTPAMLDAMMTAEVGDDVFGQDPTVNALEKKMADMFGHEAALYCPSGTMTNQIAIKAQTQPLDEIICDELFHIYRYELGGYGFHSGVSMHVTRGNRGIMSPQMVHDAVKPKADWNPNSRMLIIENSINMGGGNYYTIDEVKALVAMARSHNLKTHLDGARLFNVLVETGDTPMEYGKLFDSISICLSKGLGAPVGSVLISDKETISYARRVRKVMGGGMRQSGYLAAACIYALDHHIDRLRDDHRRARACADKLESVSWVSEVFPVSTNILIFKEADHLKVADVVAALKARNIECLAISDRLIRWVFHLDIHDDMVSQILELPDHLV